MKFRKAITGLAAFAVAVCGFAPMGAAAAPVDRGAVFYTDITAKINGAGIPYYLLDTSVAAVAVTDLTNYGFNLATDQTNKTVTVTFDPNKTATSVPVVESVGRVGATAYRYWTTDWRVIVAGKYVTAYNIAGRLSIAFKELDVFGTRIYDNANRVTSLAAKSNAGSAPAVTPPPASGKYSVSGKVTDASSGAGISGATVVVYQLSNDVTLGTAATDSYGNYTISGVIPANTNVYVEAYANGLGYGNSKTSSFSAAGNVSAKNLTLSKQSASVSGTVSDAASGVLISGATVRLKTASGATSNTSTTNSNGMYTISGVAAGSYTLEITATGYSAYTAAQFSINNTQLTKNAQLQKVITGISGKVTDASNGAGISGATVRLRNTNNAIVSTVSTNSTGDYTFASPATAYYSIEFTASGFATGTVNAFSYVTGTSAVQNKALTKANGFTVSGYITNSSGTNIAVDGVRVELRSGSATGSLVASVYTTSNGYFNFDSIPNGQYYAVLPAGTYGYQSYGESYSGVITINGASAGNVRLYLGGYSITGYVSNIPYGNTATVYVRDIYGYSTVAQSQPINAGAATTTAYTINNVPAGQYYVYAKLNDAMGTETSQQPVNVVNGNAAAPTLAFANMTVTLSVGINDTGASVPNGDVFTVMVQSPQGLQAPTVETKSFTYPNKYVQFTLTNLSAGTYYISISDASGLVQASGSVQLGSSPYVNYYYTIAGQSWAQY